MLPIKSSEYSNSFSLIQATFFILQLNNNTFKFISQYKNCRPRKPCQKSRQKHYTARTGNGRNILYDINKISNIGHGVVFSNGVEKIDTKRNSLINPNVAETNVSQNSKYVNERFSKAADTARENITEQTEVQNGERLDVEKYTDKNKPVVITDNILKGVPKKDWIPTVKKTISNKFKNGIPIKGRLIKVNRKTVNEYLYSEYTKNLRSNDKKTFKDKLRASNNLDEIIVSSINYVNEDLNHLRKDNIVQFARGNVLMQIGNNQYNAKVIIGFTSGNNMLLYDLINLTPDSFKVKIEKADTHTVIQMKKPVQSMIH